VYVGGGFTQVGGQRRDHLAALDPVSGSPTPWDPAPDGAVLALARFGPTIYAGGNFATIGGQLRQKAAGLDVADGRATAFDPGADGPVRAVATSDSAVYLGGTFSTIYNAPRSNLAEVDPARSQLMAWDPRADAPVQALAVGDDAVYVGGEFDSLGTTAQRGFAPFSPGAGSPLTPASCASAPKAPDPGPRSASPPSELGTIANRSAALTRGGAVTGIDRFSISPARVRLGGTPLTVRFMLSRSALVRLRFEQRVRDRCRVPSAGRTCARYRRFADVTGRGKPGLNRLSFPHQRINGRRLVPGRYRVTLAALPMGRGAAFRLAYFTVIPR
jgi:hypothetical protein